jgi:hypothetical protein
MALTFNIPLFFCLGLMGTGSLGLEDATASTAKLSKVTSMETIHGAIAGRGVNCPQFKLDDGRVVSLMGIEHNLLPGTKLSLTGEWVKRSICQQGQTFQVTHKKVMSK